jgi:hypothetical protein
MRFEGDRGFHVQDEWGYIDRDTHELRNLDIRASLRLHEWSPQPRVRPQLDLLVECKQSALPYVFFLVDNRIWTGGFPTIAGLRRSSVVFSSDDDPSTWENTVITALDLSEEPFQTAPPFCHTLAKCIRKGSDLELSGSDGYNAIVLPLVKAIEHFTRAEEPVSTAWYFDCHLCIGLAVLDAPLVGVRVADDGTTALIGTPWVRVARHEYDEKLEPFDRDKLWLLDVVHKDFMAVYLRDNVLPFATTFAERALRHTTELATGRAFVPRMGADGIPPYESRMSPRTTTTGAKWSVSLGRRVLSLVGRRRHDDD